MAGGIKKCPEELFQPDLKLNNPLLGLLLALFQLLVDCIAGLTITGSWVIGCPTDNPIQIHLPSGATLHPLDQPS